ncbi:MAG: hypothetical protein CL963_03480 [Euryarchaeota archaeon]|nr:hypothetical protein [Euryarchaeota archaeon]
MRLRYKVIIEKSRSNAVPERIVLMDDVLGNVIGKYMTIGECLEKAEEKMGFEVTVDENSFVVEA